MTGVYKKPPKSPRTWSLPPQPGPEVTHLRSAGGQIWRRARGDDRSWWVPVADETKHPRQRMTMPRRWHVLLGMVGSLTDASDEVK